MLGIDYGDRRIGLAVADSEDRIAVQRSVLENADDLCGRIAQIVREGGMEKVIVGLPLGLNGQETEQTRKTQAFIHALRSALTVPVDVMDERLTSVEGGSDAGAAVLILQSFLDKGISPPNPPPKLGGGRRGEVQEEPK